MVSFDSPYDQASPPASKAADLAQSLCETFDTYMAHNPCEMEQVREGISLFIATILVHLRRVCRQCDLPHEAERHVWQLVAASLAQMQALEQTMDKTTPTEKVEHDRHQS